jgi:type II secretory pathway component PulJ
MKTTPALRPKLPPNGFTLVELMVTAVASLVVIGVTLSSLITIQNMNQKLDDRLIQEAELQRSLHFIATDIREGKSIQAGAPSLRGYRALFRIVRPDGSTIGYYTTSRRKHPWSGPKIIFRKDSREAKAFALVDQISERSPEHCTGTGTRVTSPAGFSVLIDHQSKATVCIRGHLKDSPEGIEKSIQAVTRAGP